MKTRRSSGLPFTIPFALPTYWTPEQALAVFELLDDLRCPIFGHYQNWLFDEIPRNRHPDIEHYTTIKESAEHCEIPIPAYWTVEEAFAVFHLLDDLHEKIWAIYHPDLQELIRKRYQADAHQSDESVNLNPDDLPF
jgi:hypothetical protein